MATGVGLGILWPTDSKVWPEFSSDSSSGSTDSTRSSTISIRADEEIERTTTAENCHSLLSFQYMATRRNPVEKSDAFYRVILPRSASALSGCQPTKLTLLQSVWPAIVS